jgi:hypothetical protein
MTPNQIEVTNGDISKLAEVDERFRYLMQLTAATRMIEELTARVEELEKESENVGPPKVVELMGA